MLSGRKPGQDLYEDVGGVVSCWLDQLGIFACMCACMRTCVIGREGKEGRDGISHCLDRGLLDAGRKVLIRRVPHVAVVPVGVRFL